MNEYHYTLYYYDIAGNLIKTVPPEGVKFITSSADLTQIVNHRYDDVTYDDTVYTAHKMETRYWYNTLNLPIKQYTPDGDTTRFWYDVVGRLVVSQSARQRPDTFSYTIYDPLGRITEVGRLSQTTDMEQTISQSPSSLGSWISGGSNRKEVTKTFYDASVFTVPGLEQENLRSRVASTTLMDTYSATITNYDVATHYSYDIAGNVKTIVNDIKSLNSYKERYKRIDYEYDLVSGNVNKVYYQRDSADQFIYEYTYDADNRILEAKTSRDGYIWDRDANYLYYNHGPLARTEIGEQQVQALDYAYSIQGWLKGINGLHLLKSHDMGQDGNSGAMQHKRFPVDVFGMNIGYFEGDYSQITKQIKWEPQYASSAFSSASKNLYNGNIRNIALSVDKINPKTIGYSYGYDQLNRLISMDAYSSFSGTNYEWPTTSNPLKDYRERVTYDANGNILTYNRHGEGTTWKMDSLEYNYYTDKNRLHYVDDKVSAGNYPEDIDDQSSGNYTYDASGNLITDTKEGITKIEWTTYGKVKKIIKSGTTLTFSYDPAGNRIYKKVATTGQPNVFTYYIRDAQGNIMSTYVLKSDTVRWSEQMMYGSSRLGIVNLNEITAPLTFNPTDTTTTGYLEGLKNYELTNHLGNVQAVVSDKKIGIDNNNDDINNYWIAEQLVAQDYYPFGMVMPERNFSSDNYRYSFNGQEKTDEISGSGNHTTAMFWEYDTRLGRRWNQDPKPNPSISNYACFTNNPIWFTDVNGDSSVWNNKGYMVHYDPKDKDLRAFMQDGKNLTLIGNFGGEIDANKWFPNLLKENSQEADDIWNPLTFRDNVKQYGKWDYKYASPANPNADVEQHILGIAFYRQDKTSFSFNGLSGRAEDLNNLHFGVVGDATGLFSENMMLRQAGKAEMGKWAADGKQVPASWRPTLSVTHNLYIEHGMKTKMTETIMLAPYGDNPTDHEWIKKGFQYYNKNRSSLDGDWW